MPTTAADAGVVQTLWATPIWLDDDFAVPVHDTAVARLLTDPQPATAVSAKTILANSRLTAEQFRHAVRDAAGQPCGTVTVDLGVHVWSAGFCVGLAVGEADWHGWCTLATTMSQQRGGTSGALTFHDPRAGCASVTVPGLPWGRPLTVKATPGLAVVHPGWLGYSVLPVDPGLRIVMLTAGLRVT
jgi:hypothetical protein